MQWDQHDSVRYAHINEGLPVISQQNIVDKIEDSASTVFESESVIKQYSKEVEEQQV